MILCPSKNCRNEIPDDSVFCDKCGIRILKCDKCDRIAMGKFCGRCGGKMIFFKKAKVKINDSK